MSVVSDFMTADPFTAALGDALDKVPARLESHDISGLPVLDENGALVGVVSRTDVLRVSAEANGCAGRTVAYGMTTPAVEISPNATLKAAAEQMVSRHIHRLCVVDDGRLVGVISARDLMRAVESHRLESPLEQYMSATLVSTDCETSVQEALDLLGTADVSGIVITELDWPVGLFTHHEALSLEGTLRSEPVGEAMTPAMICVDVRTPLHRAAAQANLLGARRIVAVGGRHIQGIVTGIDFARAVLDADL